MNNEKTALIDSFASSRTNLIYDKKLRKYCKPISATILFSQLIYWFSKQEYKMFYKFTSPCSNGRYKEGDSWTEELGFTGREFDEAFNSIGIKISSKDQLFESKDDISKACFYSYHDRKSKLTWYNINLDKVAEVMTDCYQNGVISSKLAYSNIPDELEEMIKNIESINSDVNSINGYVNGINAQVNTINADVNTYSPTGKSIIIQKTTQDITQNINSEKEEGNLTQATACVDSLEEMEKEIQHQTESKPTTTKETNPVTEPTDRVRANATQLQEETKTLGTTPIEEKFEEFWLTYPKARRAKKAQTLLNFKKEVGENIEKADEIINSLKQQLDVDQKCLDKNLENLETRFYKKIFIPSFKESYQYLKVKDYEVDWIEKLRADNRDNKSFISLFPTKSLTKHQEYNNSEQVDSFEDEYQELETDEDFLSLLNQVENN